MPKSQETKEQRIARDRATTLADQAAKAKAVIDQRNRRFLIKATLALATAVGLGVTGLVINSVNQAPATSTSKDETSSRLKDLDPRIARNPNLLTDVAPEIAERAADDFSRATGRERISTRKIISFHSSNKEFAAAANSTNPCLNSPVKENLPATTNTETGDTYINFEAMLAENLRLGLTNRDLAAFLYEIVQHELGHLTPKKKPLKPEFGSYMSLNYPLDGYFAHGLTVRKTEADGCSANIRSIALFEEAVVQDQAARGIKSLQGYSDYTLRGYPELMQDFRLGVTGPYFPNDPDRLFQIQGESDPSAFLEEIGKRARAKYQNTGLSNGAMGGQVIYPIILKFVR